MELSTEEARAFYDRFGRKQDWQGFYEDPAITSLLDHGDFEHARTVVEFGCGTGRLAQRLLKERLPANAMYQGFDISRTMVELASARVLSWSDRAKIHLTEGSPKLPISDGTCDRFLSTYVLDLLSEEAIRATLREARRLLVPGGGRLCLASMTFGDTLPSRALCRLWSGIHRLNPGLVGGCRPLRLATFLESTWQVQHHEVVRAFGIRTEVLIASGGGSRPPA
ncbi:MAG: class I SAM-dependent methyltransferase [Myxococcales bacterium]